MIHLRAVRPRGVPAWLGIESENAAHRIAVVWDADGQRNEGVYIPRRDTSSRINTLVGGRIFPGVHQHARFVTAETRQHVRVQFTSDDGQVAVQVAGWPAAALPVGSVFRSIAEASAFFERGALGYSVTADPDRFDGLELRSRSWQVEPFAVEQLQSSFFANLVAVSRWHGDVRLCLGDAQYRAVNGMAAASSAGDHRR